MKKKWSKLKDSSGVKITRIVMNSASFALLLSVAFFSYEILEGKKETEVIVNNLKEIQNSLSTQYLGLFPEYISNINILLEKALDETKKNGEMDSLIVFEDVLYYGIRSDSKGFWQMNYNLLRLASEGYHIVIAHYDLDAMPFKNLIRESLIDLNYLVSYRKDMRQYRKQRSAFAKEIDSLANVIDTRLYQRTVANVAHQYLDNYLGSEYVEQQMLKPFVESKETKYLFRGMNNYVYVDSLAKERYFDSTNVMYKKKLERVMRESLKTIPLNDTKQDVCALHVNQMCKELDSIRHFYLNKPIDDISYADFYNMYVDLSKRISQLYSIYPNIELIPLQESLLMSCWMADINGKEHAIFAFPSKYSTEEIGFMSQDVAFADYIHKMLRGVRSNIEK